MVALRKWMAVLAAGLSLTQPLMAQDMPADHQAAHGMKMEVMAGMGAAKPAKAPLATGAAFDAKHRLWVAWVEGQHVVVAHSDDKGHTD